MFAKVRDSEETFLSIIRQRMTVLQLNTLVGLEL